MASNDQGLWRELRGLVDVVLDDVSEDEPQDWAFLLGTPALVTMAIVAVSLHLIEVFTVKLVLVLPVIRLIAAIYHFFDATRLTELERAKKREERRKRSKDSSLMPTFDGASMLWGSAGGALLVAAIGGFVFVWAFAPGAWITRYTTEFIPEEVEVLGRTQSLAFVRYPHELLVAVVIAVLGYGLTVRFIEYQRERIAKPRHLCAGLAAVAGLFAVGVLLAAAIVVALYHAGGYQSTDVSATVGALDLGLWHAASTIPFLDVTATFGWEPSWSFSGRWAGVTFLLVRGVTFAALIIFVPRLISSFIQEHTHRDERGLLSLPASLSAQFEAQLEIQDRAQKAAEEKAEPRFERANWWVGRSSSDVPSSLALECLEAEIDGVAQVFGRGELTEKADDALTALEERSEVLRRWISRRRGGYGHHFSRSYGTARTMVSDAQVKEAKKRAHRRVADFKESARKEMRDAARVLKGIT